MWPVGWEGEGEGGRSLSTALQSFCRRRAVTPDGEGGSSLPLQWGALLPGCRATAPVPSWTHPACLPSPPAAHSSLTQHTLRGQSGAPTRSEAGRPETAAKLFRQDLPRPVELPALPPSVPHPKAGGQAGRPGSLLLPQAQAGDSRFSAPESYAAAFCAFLGRQPP